MMQYPFYIVDVFAVQPFSGNQLAVVTNAQSLKDEEMLAIAREINYSETTFILSSQAENNGYPVRIFTPVRELPFAGHPTLGTAYVLQQNILKNSPQNINLNLPVGQIPVTAKLDEDGNTLFWMKQNPPEFGENFSPEEMAKIISLDVEFINLDFPIQVVSTGTPFIIVPLKNHQALKQSKINQNHYFSWCKNQKVTEILVFCPETYNSENDLSVRVFAEALGIPEDPATGSANGCLAGYLVEYNYFGDQVINVRVEQGYEINRPSLLYLKAQKQPETIDIFVGGQVFLIAEGKFI